MATAIPNSSSAAAAAAHGSGKAKLSAEELAEFREIFNLVDRDGGGTITKDELGELMATLGIDATPEELELMINEIDQDNNGEIDFDEFVGVMSRKVNANYSAEQVTAAFKVFQGSAPSGHINVKSLVHALTTYGTETLNEEQALELVTQLEPDHNGLVDYATFVSIMMSN